MDDTFFRRDSPDVEKPERIMCFKSSRANQVAGDCRLVEHNRVTSLPAEFLEERTADEGGQVCLSGHAPGSVIQVRAKCAETWVYLANTTPGVRNLLGDP